MGRRSGHDWRVFSIGEAQEAIREAAVRLPSEEVALAAAHGRVLAEDVSAAHDVPPFDNSAMDGWAVAGFGGAYAVVGESRAGAPYGGVISEGEAVVISTGAAVPAGTDAVVPVERGTKPVTTTGFVSEGAIRPGDNIRRAGEDLQAGAIVLERGTRMGAAELGVAAGAGRAAVLVAQRPKVAIVATGDELVPPGEPLRPGQIHDSNALSLAALAREAGADVVAQLRAKDDRTATTQTLDEAIQLANLVIVSGGVSVGPHDHVKPALEALGVHEHFWRVALRPGKPTWFGTRGETLVIGLPGNPVSALVTFTLFARTALAALQGDSHRPRPLRLPLATLVERHPDRDEALRVTIDDGAITTTGPQGSHVLSSMTKADALAIVPRGEGELAADTLVDVLLLR